MARYAYERLSDESAQLLAHESSRRFLHSGTTLIFESGPLARPDGGVDFPALRAAIESRLHRVPLYRRKLRRIPFEDHPVWVDDHEFNLDYHLRHTSLARPGDMQQLCKVAARVQAQRLDRSRPLWECWVLEGVSEGRFAIVMKTHAALAEGASDLLQALLSGDPEERFEPPPPFTPRPAPSSAELALDEVLRRASLARRSLRRARELVTRGDEIAERLRARAQYVAHLLGYSVRALRETPLGGSVGPHRRFETLALPLGDAKRVKSELGGSVHDILLATVTGAVARYLRAHHLNPAILDFRAAVPVSLRAGNRNEGVGEWILELPIWEKDPLRRLALVHERTEKLNRLQPALGARSLIDVGQWTPSRLMLQGVRALSRGAGVNLRLVNAPGPQTPLYLHGARLVECYGNVPLGTDGGVGVGVFSYDGKLCVGFNADFDRVPDLALFRELFAESYRELVREADRRGRRLALVRAS